jgi:3,4-dihydroxy 2-butanone 4-phosphate synthase/GTP cyclohydrolase II
VGARILQDLGITSMRLLTNNPAKYRCIEDFGLCISEKVALHTTPTDENRVYLATKKARMGHTLQDSLRQEAPLPTP